MSQINQAVILAGGRGERLRPLTDTLPKPMIPVNGRPFLEYLVELLKKNGISEIVLLVGYLSDVIIDHFGDGSQFGVTIRYSVGTVEDETGTRVRNARDMLDDKFLLMYCDNYWPIDLADMNAQFEKANANGMMTVYNNTDGKGEYGFRNNVEFDDSNLVLHYGQLDEVKPNQAIDIGFFIFNKAVISRLPESNCMIQTALLPQLIADKELIVYRSDDHYHTITTPDLADKIAPILDKYHS